MKQDLRDKLRKAGLIDKKAKKRADHQARIKRTEDKKKGACEDEVEEQKEHAFDQKIEARRRRDRERELALSKEREQQAQKRSDEHRKEEAEKREDSERLQRRYRARDLLLASMFLPKSPGPVAFHFVSRSGGIRKMHVSTRMAHDLQSGQLAIAQLPGFSTERFGLVRKDIAGQLLADDPSLVRFFVTDPKEELAETPPIVDDKPTKRKSVVRRFGPQGKGDRRDR